MSAFAAATSASRGARSASFDRKNPFGDSFHALYKGPAGLRCVDFIPRKIRRRQELLPPPEKTGVHQHRRDSAFTTSTLVSDISVTSTTTTTINDEAAHRHHFSPLVEQLQQRLRKTPSAEKKAPLELNAAALANRFELSSDTSKFDTSSSSSDDDDFSGNTSDEENNGTCFAEDNSNKKFRFQTFTELVHDANEWLREHDDMRVINCESILMLANRRGEIEHKSEFTIHNDDGSRQRYVRLLRLWVQPIDLCDRIVDASGDENDTSHQQPEFSFADQIGFTDLSGATESSSHNNSTTLNELIRRFNDTLAPVLTEEKEICEGQTLHIGRLICVHTTYANAREISTQQLRFLKLFSLDHQPTNEPTTTVRTTARSSVGTDETQTVSLPPPNMPALASSFSRQHIRLTKQRSRSNSKSTSNKRSSSKSRVSQKKLNTLLKWYQVLRIFYTLPAPQTAPNFRGVEKHTVFKKTSNASTSEVKPDDKLAIPNGVFLEDFWPSSLDDDESYYEHPCLAVETFRSLFDKIADWVQARASTIRVLNFQTIFVPEDSESSLETSYTVHVKHDAPTRVRMRKVIRLNYTNVYIEEDDELACSNEETLASSLTTPVEAVATVLYETENQAAIRSVQHGGSRNKAEGIARKVSSMYKNNNDTVHRNQVLKAECDKVARRQSHTLLSHKLFYPGTVKEERMASGFIPGRTVESARHVLGRIDAWAARENVRAINVETITTPYSTGVERHYGFDVLMTEIHVAADTPSLFVGEFLHIYRIFCDGFYPEDSVQSQIDPPTDPSESCSIL